MRYFDTGVLLKLYLSEPNSPRAVELDDAAKHKLPITELHLLEMKSAIAQKHQRGELTVDEKESVLRILDEDVFLGVLRLFPVNWSRIFNRAQHLAVSHTAQAFCRSLDALHVASAIELGADEFCSFDGRQSRMAEAAKLKLVS